MISLKVFCLTLAAVFASTSAWGATDWANTMILANARIKVLLAESNTRLSSLCKQANAANDAILAAVVSVKPGLADTKKLNETPPACDKVSESKNNLATATLELLKEKYLISLETADFSGANAAFDEYIYTGNDWVDQRTTTQQKNRDAYVDQITALKKGDPAVASAVDYAISLSDAYTNEVTDFNQKLESDLTDLKLSQ